VEARIICPVDWRLLRLHGFVYQFVILNLFLDLLKCSRILYQKMLNQVHYEMPILFIIVIYKMVFLFSQNLPMKKSLICAILVFIVMVSACSTSKQSAVKGLPPYVPESKELHNAIALMDSIFFDAYNTCKLDVFASLISDSIEFYHDRGGLLTSKPILVESIKNNICNKVRRELLKGSIEVHPVPNYGAIQMGAHRFHNLIEKSTSRYAKFVTIWKKENNQWKVTRVISLH
jgi:hypothetical protein